MEPESAETPVETEAPNEGVLRKLRGSSIAPAVREMMITEAALSFPACYDGCGDEGDADGDGE